MNTADSAFGVSEIGGAVWFGVIVVKVAELCLINPPIGLNCFVVSGKEAAACKAFPGGKLFLIADALATLLPLFLLAAVL